MKIILSRKGFDSSAGGYPSPYFKNDGRLLSLPIPEENKIYSTDTGRRYSDLRFNDNFTYVDIMNQLGISGFEDKNVHLDPDINHNVVINRSPEWKGMFGQCDAAQQHLTNNNIQPGDLFLFFGWFRNVIEKNGRFEYLPNTDKHIIWGYMQVGKIDYISESTEYEPWKLEHPHYRNRKRKYNTAYIAKDYLDFSPDLPGCGVLKYHETLELTYPSISKKSIWKLPSFFYPSYGTCISYHKDIARWALFDDHCMLRSVNRGQEFVITGNEQTNEWAKELILNANYNKDRSSDNKNNSGLDLSITMICTRKATGEEFEVKYNADDNNLVQQYQWKIEKNNLKVYAVKQGTENVYLHRLIAGNCEEKNVKTRNGDYLDCRRENLYIQDKKQV